MRPTHYGRRKIFNLGRKKLIGKSFRVKITAANRKKVSLLIEISDEHGVICEEGPFEIDVGDHLRVFDLQKAFTITIT
jgi:hypothetical protein